MNLKVVVSVAVLGMQGLMAKAEYREFTDAKGRTITAELISCNALQNKVTIRLKGKGMKTVPTTIFSEADQKYIVSWNKNQDFLSERNLKIKFTRHKDKDAENSVSHSGLDRKYYNCNFSIECENRSTVDFSNVDLEYVIYYEQDHHIHGNSDKEGREGTLYERKTISIPSKSTKKIESKNVVLYDCKFPESSSGTPALDGEMHGIMVQLSIKSSTGEKISRRFKFPQKLSRVWMPKTKNVQSRPSN